MSHILIKQVQQNQVAAPASNYLKLFSNLSDNGILYWMDSSGTPYPVGLSSSQILTLVNEVTFLDLYTLYSTQNFATFSYYLITDFETIYDQPDFYCDGTAKTVPALKSKPSGVVYQPLLVQASSYNTLYKEAFQPPYPSLAGWSGYPKDYLEYDISFLTTEFNGQFTKGRITKRIDEFGNETDYDHRMVRYKRYQKYNTSSALSGTITDYNCITGQITGSSTQFTSEVNVDDVLLLDTKSTLGYQIGVVVVSITNNTSLDVKVDISYVSGVPSPKLVSNGRTITAVDYSFSSQSFGYSIGVATGDYTEFQEVYFGQSDLFDYDDEIYTFQFSAELLSYSVVKSIDNNLGNHSVYWKTGTTTLSSPYILSNIVVGENSFSNKFGDNSYNFDFGQNCYYNNIGNESNSNVINTGFQSNRIGSEFKMNRINDGFSNNIIEDNFSQNVIGDNFRNNKISNDFSNNSILSGFDSNQILSSFESNIVDSNFQFNQILCDILSTDFTSATHVYQNYNCQMFLNSSSNSRLSYYDGFDVLTITDIDS